jgi:hypothetical protein
VINNNLLESVLSDGFKNLDMKSVGSTISVLAIGKANASRVAIGKASAITDVLGNLEVKGSLTVTGIPTSANTNFSGNTTLLTKSQVVSLIDDKLIPKDKYIQSAFHVPIYGSNPKSQEMIMDLLGNTSVEFAANELTLGDTYKILIVGQIGTFGTSTFSVGFHLARTVLVDENPQEIIDVISLVDIVLPTTLISTSFQTDFQFQVMTFNSVPKFYAFGRVFAGAVVKSFMTGSEGLVTVVPTVAGYPNRLSITGKWSTTEPNNSMVVSYIRVYKVH